MNFDKAGAEPGSVQVTCGSPYDGVESPQTARYPHAISALTGGHEDPTKRCVTFDCIDDAAEEVDTRRRRTKSGDAVYNCDTLSKELFKIRARAEEEAVSKAFRSSRSPTGAKTG